MLCNDSTVSRDWTVVLERRCDECAAEVWSLGPHDIARSLRQAIDDWVTVLQTEENRDALLVRPAVGVWSAVEYAYHVAEVIDVFQARVFAMLTEDIPEFEDWVPEQRAEPVPLQTPETAMGVIVGAGERMSAIFESLHPSLNHRPGRRPDGYEYTVVNVGRYVLHDVLHHLFDATSGLKLLSLKGTQ